MGTGHRSFANTELDGIQDSLPSPPGPPHGAKQRQQLWFIFESIQKVLSDRGLMSWESLWFEAARVADGKCLFAHIIADEFQDLGSAELILLNALSAKGYDSLFFCGDSGQRIYKRAVPWLSLGVDVRGRSSSLTLNYRTTEQIRRFADRLLADSDDNSTGETEDHRSISLLSGSEPEVVGRQTVAQEIQQVASRIEKLIKEGFKPGEIAIFVHGQSLLRDRAAAACRQANVFSRELSDDSPIVTDRVAIGTMHRAKVSSSGRLLSWL